MTEFLRSFAIRERWMGVLRTPAFRWTIAVILLFLVFIKLALPLFVSTANVKDNMEAALSRWTGTKATIDGRATISFWPGPSLTLSDVRFVTQDDATPVATATAITADFDLLAALGGRPVFYDFHLREPVLSVRRGRDGQTNWPIPDWMSRSIAADRSARNPTPAGEPIGDIVIDNGTLAVEDTVTGQNARLHHISGTIAWRTPAAMLSANLSAIAHDEPVDLSITCDAPMAFLAGQESGLRLSLGSGPLRLSFDGRGTGGRYPGVEGSLEMKTPSIAGLVHWFGMDVPAATSASPMSIEAAVNSGPNGVKMDNLSLMLGSANATGLLDLSLRSNANPKLNGTLAFDRLQAEELAPLFPLVSHVNAAAAPQLPERVDVDLRLSAQSASYGLLTLTDLAAGVMVNGDKASIDIGDSGYAGGSLNGRVSVVEGGLKGGDIQLSLKNTNLTALAADLGLSGPMLEGEGTLSLDLSTQSPLKALTPDDVSGDIRFSGRSGMLARFDAEAFQTLVAQGKFFDSASTTDGGFPTQSSDIIATVKDGVATLEKAEIRGEQQTLFLTGLIPFHTNGLALAGSLTTNDGSRPAARFFAGGSWPNAVISPLSTLPDQP